MKMFWIIAVVLVFSLNAWAEDVADTATTAETAETAVEEEEVSKGEDILKTEKARLSYCLGLNIGANFKGQEIAVDIEALVRGIEDAITESKPLLTDEEVRGVMTAFQSEQMTKQHMRGIRVTQENTKEGEAYLAENVKKDGVKTTESGLQYEILKEGSGASPSATDTVTVHYAGTFVNGEAFDSSYERGEPSTFPLNGVIAGWTEGLQLMKTGAKWRFVIPSNLAYGERGRGGIEPGKTLIFEIELISIEAK